MIINAIGMNGLGDLPQFPFDVSEVKTVKHRKHRFISAMISVSLLSLTLTGCSRAKPAASDKVAVEKTESLMKILAEAWHTENGTLMGPLYSDAIIGFDAIETQTSGWSFNKEGVDAMRNDPEFWANFDIGELTYFVSQDGKYGAFATIFDFTPIHRGVLPASEMNAWVDGKLVYSYDYYGGMVNSIEKSPVYPERTLDPESTLAKESVSASFDVVTKWQKAYNGRKLTEFMSCYSATVKYIDMTRTEWRIMSKDLLAKDTEAHFAKATFKSKLQASNKSPIPNGFFVSADGHYAAAQGDYIDEGFKSTPMMVVLEIEDGSIIRQYNYFYLSREYLNP